MDGNGVGRFVAPVVAGVVASLSLVASAPQLLRAQDVATHTSVAAHETATQLVTINVDDTPLPEVLQTIARQARLIATYNERIVSPQTRVSVHLRHVSATTAFEAVLRGTDLVAQIRDNGKVLIVPGSAAVAGGIIAGIVTDARTGKPLKGCLVVLDGAKAGVTTGEDGHYRIASVAQGAHTVHFRLLGFVRQSRSVSVNDGETATVDVSLSESANTLEQVVVTGTVIPTELKSVPSAITVITAKDLEQRGVTRLDQLFRGDVPGLFAQNLGSQSLLDAVTMYSRGATSMSPMSAGTGTAPTDLNATWLTNTTPIKTFVDGVELADARYISQIDPKSIERIEILTGPQASTIYGSNALNGVMQIFTKRGVSSHAQLTLSALTGWVENDFSSAHTPQHDLSGQVNDVQGRIAYNAGGSWVYIGPWTPGKQTTRTTEFGGARWDVASPVGPLKVDGSLRLAHTLNRQDGRLDQFVAALQQTGEWTSYGNAGYSPPAVNTLDGQTTGLTVNYAPFSWWSHEVGIGQDASTTETRDLAKGYQYSGDTSQLFYQYHETRRTQRFSMTASVPATSLAKATITLGGDAWQSVVAEDGIYASSLQGYLGSSAQVTRRSDHNSGAFLQAQLGLADALFLTYGLRVEWNPNFGGDQNPNYAPRVGAALSHDLGAMTAKLRASYGRSTRPPRIGAKRGTRASSGSYYGNPAALAAYGGDYWFQFPNADLLPEHQQGGEGGIELYFGNRGSLVVTRYNQTVDNLVDQLKIDSVRSVIPNPPVYFSLDQDGYGYISQYENLNVGSIRNQGWELQGTTNVGPLTMKGTYSWTKSRTLRVTPKYQSIVAGNSRYVPGASFDNFAEHTWALAFTYARSQTVVALTINGVGKLREDLNTFWYQHLDPGIRLQQDIYNASPWNHVGLEQGYASADLTASRRLWGGVEAQLQGQNLTNAYHNDFWSVYPTMGRQVKAGVKWTY